MLCLNVMSLENKVCNVSYIVLSFMFMKIICCHILCYLFMFVSGIYYKLFNFFSFLFPNKISHNV